MFDITTPTGGAELITTPTLQWTESIDAAEYTVEVAAVSAPATPVQMATVPDTSLALDPLAPGDYLVSVTALDAAGNQQPADNDGLSFSIVASPEPLTMFVTANLYVNNGDTSTFPPSNPFFGSIDTADYYTSFSAYQAGLIPDWDFITPVYRAVLSDDTVDARDRVPTDRAIVNVLGETVADSAMDLFSGNLQRPVNVDQFGNTVTSTLSAWTGSGSSGSGDQTCGSWLNPSLSGSVGDVAASDAQWISSGLQTCFSQARFYAVGPFEPEPSDLPEPFSILEPSGFIDTATPTVTWEASEFATSYEVDIALDANATDVVQEYEVSGTSLTIDPLAEGEYYIAVSARNAAGSRESSNSGLSFTYDVTPPGMFAITTPTGGAELINTPHAAVGPVYRRGGVFGCGFRFARFILATAIDNGNRHHDHA